jgi:aspartate-semialdehyde dehydrogenase
VISNAGSHRMKADVPLLIPEINPDHLDALTSKGNVSAARATSSPSKLHVHRFSCFPSRRCTGKFGRRSLSAWCTMQAISGADIRGGIADHYRQRDAGGRARRRRYKV